MDKLLDVKKPKPGTRYILVVPRVDIGSPLGGRPSAYIGVDDLVMQPTKEGEASFYVGRRYETQVFEGKEQQVAVPVFQFPSKLDYQLFLRDDIEFVDALALNKKHWEFEKKAQAVHKEIFKDMPLPPDVDGNPGQYI